jgi:aldose 1-epimerase
MSASPVSEPATASAVPLSGTQFDLSLGDYEASIASVGASLRTLTFRGRDLIVPFDADEVRPAFRGATLAPWPNRVTSGEYSFGGIDHLLALTEPGRSNALHGLATWADFAPVTVEASRVILATTIEAQAGYPYRLLIEVLFELTADGLYSSVTATNTGRYAAPYGTGPHPYLIAGAGTVDDWSLTLPVESVLQVTEDRLIPIGLEPVDATAFDFRSARPIGDTFIDHAFTGLARTDGVAEVRVETANGSGVAMRWDAACPWVQVHTADQPTPETSRRGLAVEPMTCPPDAFNSGTDLIVLEPGASHTAGWTIAAL